MKEQLFGFLSSNVGALTLENILLNFLMASVLGFAIYISYKFSHSNVVYSARFNVSLMMLTLTTTLVMNVIGNNIALSLGMVGALSIVRFRTAIKDPRDSMYIFWCISVGICCGVSEYLIASIGSSVIFLFMVLFGFIKSNDRYLLIVRGSLASDELLAKEIDMLFKHNATLKVKNTTRDTLECIYELSQKTLESVNGKNSVVTSALFSLDGIEAVNIICQNDEINR